MTAKNIPKSQGYTPDSNRDNNQMDTLFMKRKIEPTTV